MNEVLSITFGALVAIGSGMITAWWNGRLERKRLNMDAKQKCYSSILRCCNSYLLSDDNEKKYKCEDFDSLFMDIQLYASQEVCELFRMFVAITKKDAKERPEGQASEMLQILRSQIKKELNLE